MLGSLFDEMLTMTEDGQWASLPNALVYGAISKSKIKQKDTEKETKPREKERKENEQSEEI